MTVNHLIGCAACTAILGVAGCTQTVETSDGRPMPPEPRAAPTTPEQARVNAIAVVLGAKPVDTNGNLRPDLIQMQVFLFSRPYPSPIWREGTLDVRIYRSGEAGDPRNPGPSPLRTWQVTPQMMESLRTRSLVGDGYAISLSLLDDGQTDALGVSAVDFMVRFLPIEGGEAVPMAEVRPISLASPVMSPGR